MQVEMHTGKPLFPGYDPQDQMNRIINVLGMIPSEIIALASPNYRGIYFDEFPMVKDDKKWIEYRAKVHKIPPSKSAIAVRYSPLVCTVADYRINLDDVQRAIPNGPTSLGEILRNADKYGVDEGHQPRQYEQFQDFILQMLDYK